MVPGGQAPPLPQPPPPSGTHIPRSQWKPTGHGVPREHEGGITHRPPTQMLPGGHPFMQSPVTGRH